MTAGEWCVHCHHLVVPGIRGWVHYSDDDWTGDSCACVLQLRSCRPPAGARIVQFTGITALRTKGERLT